MLKRILPLAAALHLLWACSSSKPGAPEPQGDLSGAAAAAAPGTRSPVLPPEEEILFSEVSEFIKLGQDGMRDSLWFEAGADFDSALVQLSALESTDSLSPSVYSRIQAIRDSVQKLLIYTVAMSSQMSAPAPLGQQFDEDMEEVPDSAVKSMDSITHFIDASKFSLPLTTPLEPRILQAMAVFMGPGRGYFTKWLNRKSRYEAMMHARLEARGMPKDLIYLAMVESGFNPKAWSTASASGLWQFISGTGRRYGLKDDWWVDPRRDPVRATEAALEYLADLHDEFQDWHQAMAAYNCGEGRVRRHRNQDSTMTYWQMPLPKETRFYVPKILAAMIIGHNPERYGFILDKPEPPLAFDTATVSHCLTIATIAKSAGIPEDSVLAYNPALRRWCTPPNQAAGYTLNLPVGTRETFLAAYEALDKTQLVNWHHHIVSKGETISSIAGRYRVSVAAIKATNKIKGSRLSRGQSLLIPLAPGDAGKYAEMDVAETSGRQSKFKGGTYKVRSGDNLFDIARRFNTTVSALLAANNLRRGAVIKPGQRIKLSGKGVPAAGNDEGDNHREPVAAKAIKARSRPEAAEAAVDPGEDGPSVKDPPAGKFGVHTVGAGETLYSISRELGVEEDDLARWNGIRGSRIQAGQKLKYQAPKNTPSKAGPRPGSDALAAAGTDGDATRKASAPRLSPVAAAGFVGASAPKEEKQYYVVKAGDTLWDISTKHRSTVQKLKDLNGRLPQVLKPGTRIRVK